MEKLNKENEIVKCEVYDCNLNAVEVETYKGRLYHFCRFHAKMIRKQKKADNNI